MSSRKERPRRIETTLVREFADWGVSVSEKRNRLTWRNTLLLLLGTCILLYGLMLVAIFLVGFLMDAEISSPMTQVVILLSIIGLGALLSILSRKGPRTALELDPKAGQLRLGFRNRYGAFVRRRVVPLKQVDAATVVTNKNGQLELNLVINGEEVGVELLDARPESLGNLATQICDAAQHARSPARRSRIESSIAGIGASYREMTNRVTSRIFQ